MSKTEHRIYIVDVCNYEFDTDPRSWTDEKFISEAEIQGNVYSLKGFQNAFNNSEVVSESFMRII